MEGEEVAGEVGRKKGGRWEVKGERRNDGTDILAW